MHIITPYEPKVILTTWEGVTRTYESRLVALKDLGFTYIRYRIKPRVDAELGWSTLVTEHGVILGLADFVALNEALAPRAVSGPNWLHRMQFWNGTGPVPGCGVHHSRRYHRHPKTMHERRLNAFWDAEAGEPRPRGRRSPANIPNAYNDIARSDYHNHSWKHHRKTQWKG